MRGGVGFHIRCVVVYTIWSIALTAGGTAHAGEPPSIIKNSASGETARARPAYDRDEEPVDEAGIRGGGVAIPVGPFRLTLNAGLRLRGEIQHNFNIKRYGDRSCDEILLERARLELGLRFSHQLRFFAQAQDAREVGCDFSHSDFQSGSPYENHLDLRQAHLEWTGIAGAPIGIKVGRQSIAFTDNRLMGPGEWGNVGRYAWDAIRLTWRSASAGADIFYSFRVKYDPTGFDHRHFDYDVLGLFSTFRVRTFNLHGFYFLRMNNFPSGDDRAASESFHRHSPGVSLEGAPGGGIDLGVGLIPQLGRWGDKKVSALGAYAVLGYTAGVYGEPRIGLHYAYGSGDPNLDDGTARTFDGVFGAVDKYYGRMNLFAWANLHDLQLALSGKALKTVKVALDYHLFALAEERDAWYYANGKRQAHDPGGASGKVVGHEVDLVAGIKATRYTRLQVGYGVFVPGDTARNTGSDDPAHWGFMQMSYDY